MSLFKKVFSFKTRRGILSILALLFVYNLMLGVFIAPNAIRESYNPNSTMHHPVLPDDYWKFVHWMQSIPGTILSASVIIPLLVWSNRRSLRTPLDDPRFQRHLYWFGAFSGGAAGLLLHIIFRTFVVGW